jgi:hypothetical protein
MTRLKTNHLMISYPSDAFILKVSYRLQCLFHMCVGPPIIE